MKKLAVIYDEAHLKHSPPFPHPEKPDRATFVYNYLNEKNFFDKADLVKPTKASKDDILRVHTNELYNFVVESIHGGISQLDEDTYIVKDSLEPALLSAGAVLNAVDLVMDESYFSVFSLMRPPGHHAETKRSMGFCLFNNVAVGAKYALDKYKLERIAIIDWDVHHGNGTQEIFYYSNQVYFISLHQYPL
ncbi:MAG TPA: histone deacetylase, partial [Ignavibacteriaceae bacterium]|nr:histone deacetylase [Ignavibacteriaceae bacterium]